MGSYWNETLETGIETLDKSYQKLFDVLVLYDRAVAENGVELASRDLFDFLKKYIANHFPAEEATQKEYQYPEYAIHAAQHKYLINKLALLEKKSTDSPNFANEVHRNVVNWLLDHVTKNDKTWIAFVKEKAKAAQAKLAQELKKCPQCGNENAPDAAFCAGCGKNLKG